jgi:hypothetical protein
MKICTTAALLVALFVQLSQIHRAAPEYLAIPQKHAGSGANCCCIDVDKIATCCGEFQEAIFGDREPQTEKLTCAFNGFCEPACKCCGPTFITVLSQPELIDLSTGCSLMCRFLLIYFSNPGLGNLEPESPPPRVLC